MGTHDDESVPVLVAEPSIHFSNPTSSPVRNTSPVRVQEALGHCSSVNRSDSILLECKGEEANFENLLPGEGDKEDSYLRWNTANRNITPLVDIPRKKKKKKVSNEEETKRISKKRQRNDKLSHAPITFGKTSLSSRPSMFGPGPFGDPYWPSIVSNFICSCCHYVS